MAFQSSCDACSACFLFHALCSCLRSRETVFDAARARGFAGARWAACRACLSGELSRNLLVSFFCVVMALEIVATSPPGVGMLDLVCRSPPAHLCVWRQALLLWHRGRTLLCSDLPLPRCEVFDG